MIPGILSFAKLNSMELFILLEFPYVRVLYGLKYTEYQKGSEDSKVTLGPKIDILCVHTNIHRYQTCLRITTGKECSSLGGNDSNFLRLFQKLSAISSPNVFSMFNTLYKEFV
jgi:hypothetical protein